VTQPLRAPLYRVFLILGLTAIGALSQTQSGTAQTPPQPPASPTLPAPPPVDKNAPEMATKEAPALFTTRVNLVMVPVVVRDAKGHTLGTYTKENFQLFDKGKPQEITRFTVEKSGDKAAKAAQTVDTLPTVEGEPAAPPDIPERFVAYLFDDMHLQFGDLVRARDAASHQLAAMPKTDRAAIYTTSGQNQLDFTDDKDKLQAMLLLLRTRSISTMGGISQCPDISAYMADQIVNKNDTNALSLAAQEAMACNPGLPLSAATMMAQNAAMQMLGPSEQETRISLSVLKEVVRRMAAMPGQRIVVMLSPGFLASEQQQEKSDIMDRAIRSNVLISSLDARGLWVDSMFDASKPGGAATTAFLLLKQQYEHFGATAQADVLAEMAYGTGGSFFQNNNDLDAGLRQLAAAPEYYYILGFSPQNLKLDGSFHALKVGFKTPSGAGLAVQARKGYYAPKKLSNAAETAKEEIEEALFSRDEMSELPVELHTQYFKAGDKDATIAVLCRINPGHIHFRKAEGRNENVLTILSAVFDRNGNFLSAIQKTVDLKLKDETLAKLTATGVMSVKTNFSVPPGTYMVRLVVRDSEGQLMSALNGAVAIQ
jgi:VWFA-related protein